MKVFAFSVEDQNLALFDPWSVIHTSTGLFAGLVGLPFAPSIAAAVAYEFFEQIAEGATWGKKIFRTSGSETTINMVSDVLLFAIGWYLGDVYHKPRRALLSANPLTVRSRTPQIGVARLRRGIPSRPRGLTR